MQEEINKSVILQGDFKAPPSIIDTILKAASFVAQLVKDPPATRDLGWILGLGRSPREGKGYPLQYFGLENSIDCIVHGVSESDMTERLSLSLSLKQIKN